MDGWIYLNACSNDFVLCIHHHQRAFYLIKHNFHFCIHPHEIVVFIPEACACMHRYLSGAVLSIGNDFEQYETEKPWVYCIYFYTAYVDELYAPYPSMEIAPI